LIKVTGGKINAATVQTQLAKFITADWNWEALPHGDDSFLVEFRLRMNSNEELILIFV